MGATPTYANAEILNQIYYSDCVQKLIEYPELCLDEGLELPSPYGTELDLDGLFRMDTATLYKANNDAVGGGWMSPNEARKRVDLPPVEGGNTPYLQQQNFSLQALNKRDTQADPFGTAAPAEPPASEPEEPTEEEIADQARMLALLVEKEMSSANHA